MPVKCDDRRHGRPAGGGELQPRRDEDRHRGPRAARVLSRRPAVRQRQRGIHLHGVDQAQSVRCLPFSSIKLPQQDVYLTWEVAFRHRHHYHHSYIEISSKSRLYTYISKRGIALRHMVPLSKYMRCSGVIDVIVITRRHVGGMRSVNTQS